MTRAEGCSINIFLDDPNNKEIKRKVNRFPYILKNYDLCKSECNYCIDLCNRYINDSIKDNKEEYYNSAFFVKIYSRAWKAISGFWFFLNKKEYDQSWYELQDALSYLDILIKNNCADNSLHIRSIIDNLLIFEEMFPYKLFISPCYLVKKKTCTICDRDIMDPDCTHISGNIYWGRIAQNKVEISDLLETSCVTNPYDKKLFIKSPQLDYSFLDKVIDEVDSPLRVLEKSIRLDGGKHFIVTNYVINKSSFLA